MLSALSEVFDRYASQASLIAKFGVKFLSGISDPVIGFVQLLLSQDSMADRSNVCPSLVKTGSSITSCVMGQTKKLGASPNESSSSTDCVSFGASFWFSNPSFDSFREDPPPMLLSPYSRQFQSETLCTQTSVPHVLVPTTFVLKPRTRIRAAMCGTNLKLALTGECAIGFAKIRLKRGWQADVGY